MTRDDVSTKQEIAKPQTHEGDGDTIIADIVVAKVASAAAKEVGGIHGMGSQGVGDRVSLDFSLRARKHHRLQIRVPERPAEGWLGRGHGRIAWVLTCSRRS